MSLQLKRKRIISKVPMCTFLNSCCHFGLVQPFVRYPISSLFPLAKLRDFLKDWFAKLPFFFP